MIKQITMKNCASYNETGVLIDDCDRVNFIYGHNGSGKSTISNYLANFHNTKYAECSIVWDLGAASNILVYNKNFRERNLQSTDMPGVFTLGEATAEQLAELERLRKSRAQREKEYHDYRVNLESKNQEKLEHLSAYENAVWEQVFRKNDASFKEAFIGFRSKKALFFERIRTIYNSGYKTIKTRADIETACQTLFGQKPERQILLSYPSLTLAQEIEANELWNKIIIGNKDVDIAGLIEMLNMSDWVKTGQAYIQETGICPFCQRKTITSDLKAQFDKYFSGEYERQVELMEQFEKQYKEFIKNTTEELQILIANIKALPIETDISIIEKKIATYHALLNENLAVISSKKAEPSRIFSIQSSAETSKEIYQLISNINEKINNHNILVDNFKAEKDQLVNAVWNLIVFENKTLLAGYETKLNGLEKAISSISERIEKAKNYIDELDEQIVESNKHITSVQPTVDAINRSLKAYGFEGFSIAASPEDPNRYQIQRPNGDIASETLSEGEETFISFLYFMYLTQGGINQESISQHKIIVIDDPICSLDSSILYVVSSMVRDLIAQAKKGINNIDQIFVLTHNVYFHKEITFIDGRDQEDSKSKFWTLKKKEEVSTCTAYERKNPIKTTYAILWSEVKENSGASTVSLQNAMRRILENFFGTLGNTNSRAILDYFDSVEERSICRSLFSWANDGSHSIPDDLEFSEKTDAPDKYRKVFKDIFYKTHNEYHYDRMME